MTQTYTYRKDLYYIQRECLIPNGTINGEPSLGVNERVVNPLIWYINRIQFWKYSKLKNFNVLRERWLDMSWNCEKPFNYVWWHSIIDKLFRKKY